MEDLVLVSKIKYQKDLKETVDKAVKALGGWKKFVKKGEVILLKPNFNTADPYPASTALDFLETVVKAIQPLRPKTILLAESSTYTLNTRKVLEKTGALKLCQKLAITPYVFEEKGWLKKKIPSAKYLKEATIPQVLDRVDKIILLPCLKTHRYARFTASLKLAVGFLKSRERSFLHQENLEEKIAELNTLFRPDLIIMDARKCFVTNGPESGEVREPNLILASTDRIAIDIEGLKILKSYPAKNKLDLGLREFPQIKRAVELGLGAKSDEEHQLIEG